MPFKNGPAKLRYVAATQSLLVLCTVGAALVPAATLVTLDVVRQSPAADGGHTAPVQVGALSAYTTAALTPSKVDVAPVNPTVRQVAMTSAVPTTALPHGLAGGGAGRVGKTAARAAKPVTVAGKPTSAATETHPASTATTVTSTPQPVTGYGTVGLTWEHGDNLTESEVKAEIRTEKNGVWSKWTELEYDDDGPDSASTEGTTERPGTIEGLVGHVDEVQGRITVTGAPVPPDLKLAVIDPGEPTKTATEAPAIDTGRIDPGSATPDAMTAAQPGVVGGVEADAIPASGGGSARTAGGLTNVADTTGTTDPTDPAGPTDPTSDQSDPADPNAAPSTTDPSDPEQAALAAAAYTPKPQIYSRAQWGANESLRDKPSLHYGEIHGGFVHHTVNANDYTAAEVPGIIRSIYAYHVKSRGWSDIGYNFLIDKFGRIWEGRYGGVDRPVVGAHTENYNDDGFGVSAIGNYDIAQPSSALIQAEGAIFAWKLSLEGVSAAATNVKIEGHTFASSIMGHRDTKATACPGKYLYAKIPQIRKLAAGLQKGWAGRQLQHNLTGTAYPDVIARKTSDKMGYIFPTGGLLAFSKPATALTGVASTTRTFVTPDVTGDNRADLVEVAQGGTVTVVRGTSTGTFSGSGVVTSSNVFKGTAMLTAVGDVTGDGRNDLVARNSTTYQPVIFKGDGNGHFTRVATSGPRIVGINLITATGDVTGDHNGDLIYRDTNGHLWVVPGNGKGGFGTAREASGTWNQYTAITGFGDYTGDGISDLMVRSANGSTSIRPALGNGNFGRTIGWFGSPESYDAVIGGAQLTSDASPELFLRKGTTIATMQNTGRYDLGKPIATGVNLSAANLVLNAGDWNGDGHNDMIVRRTDGDLYLYLGKGTGKFAAATRLATGFGSVTQLAAVGDVTGDNIPDLQGRKGSGGLYIWPGLRGPSRLGAPYFSHAEVSGRQIAAGTWTGDGAPDSFFLSGSKLTLYPGDGPGGLAAGAQKVLSSTFSGYADSSVTAVGPLATGNSAPALLAPTTTGLLYGILRSSSGGLGAKYYLGSGFTGYDLIS